MPQLIPPPKLPKRHRETHKREVGRILIVGGTEGMLGATLLAGESALRCGSGLVTIASTASHVDWPALHCPELMSADAMQISRERIAEIADVVVLGPGLGQGEWGKQVFDRFIDCELPLVVDADGLNWLARKPRQCDRWVLTPHVGEAARLLGRTATEVQAERLHAAREIATQYGGVCVLKGPGTLVACADDSIWICDKGNPGMATAGMGDVLSGIVAALLGQGASFSVAATTAVWLHACAADTAVRKIGERGLLARDVITYVATLVCQIEQS